MFASTLTRRAAALTLAAALLCGIVFAADPSVSSGSLYCFRMEDFAPEGSIGGIYVVSVPDSGELRCGSRVIRSGDVLSASSLSLLTLNASADFAGSFIYRPISGTSLGEAQSIDVSLFSGKNTAPVCENGELETYKNIPNTGALSATDADSDRLTYQLVKSPKRGTVELRSDGTFLYTPKQNKVGKDSFVFTATDTAGNVSNEATVRIKIVKPTDKATYDDVPEALLHTAMWMKEAGLYGGKSVSGHLCFEPDASVTRGEFLVMTMKLLDVAPDDAMLTSGFADERTTPAWMRPYIVSAFRNGMISGVSMDGAVTFRPEEALTRAEAAVMLQNILKLPVPDLQTVFAAEEDGETVPTWAQEAVGALWQAGFTLSGDAADKPITRGECAKLLYELFRYLQSDAAPSFYWMKNG